MMRASRAPPCFASCEFYDPRPDMKCRHFRSGFFAVPVDAAANGRRVPPIRDAIGAVSYH